jgi:RecA-family ATPase
MNRAASRGAPAFDEAVSRFPTLKGTERGNRPTSLASGGSGQLIKVWEQPEPEARRFLIAKLIPEGAVTSLYGDGGVGKSLVALHIGLSLCVGISFAGLDVIKGNVLYLDGELDALEFTRRAYRVARGMRLDQPPSGLYYFQLPGPLTDKTVYADVVARLLECKPVLIILDSLTIATFASDPSDAQSVIHVIKQLEQLGTVLAIDHIPKTAPGVNMSHLSQFGSGFKRYAVRSQLQLIKADAGGLTLLHKKANFGPQSEPIHLALDFQEDRVIVSPISADDERLAGADKDLPTEEQVYHALIRKGQEGASAKELAAQLEMKDKTVSNYLTTLKKKGRATSIGDGRWQAIS